MNLRKTGFFFGGDAVSDLTLRTVGATLVLSGSLRDRVEENSRKSAMHFLFVKDLGLPFSSAVFAFRGDFSRRVSKNRDFLRVGDDDPPMDLPGQDDDGKMLPTSRSSTLTCGDPSRVYVGGVRGRYPNSATIVAAWLDNAGSILIFVSDQRIISILLSTLNI
jgi:hypothetical protein